MFYLNKSIYMFYSNKKFLDKINGMSRHLFRDCLLNTKTLDRCEGSTTNIPLKDRIQVQWVYMDDDREIQAGLTGDGIWRVLQEPVHIKYARRKKFENAGRLLTERDVNVNKLASAFQKARNGTVNRQFILETDSDAAFDAWSKRSLVKNLVSCIPSAIYVEPVLNACIRVRDERKIPAVALSDAKNPVERKGIFSAVAFNDDSMVVVAWGKNCEVIVPTQPVTKTEIDALNLPNGVAFPIVGDSWTTLTKELIDSPALVKAYGAYLLTHDEFIEWISQNRCSLVPRDSVVPVCSRPTLKLELLSSIPSLTIQSSISGRSYTVKADDPDSIIGFSSALSRVDIIGDASVYQRYVSLISSLLNLIRFQKDLSRELRTVLSILTPKFETYLKAKLTKDDVAASILLFDLVKRINEINLRIDAKGDVGVARHAKTKLDILLLDQQSSNDQTASVLTKFFGDILAAYERGIKMDQEYLMTLTSTLLNYASSPAVRKGIYDRELLRLNSMIESAKMSVTEAKWENVDRQYETLLFFLVGNPFELIRLGESIKRTKAAIRQFSFFGGEKLVSNQVPGLLAVYFGDTFSIGYDETGKVYRYQGSLPQEVKNVPSIMKLQSIPENYDPFSTILGTVTKATFLSLLDVGVKQITNYLRDHLAYDVAQNRCLVGVIGKNCDIRKCQPGYRYDNGACTVEYRAYQPLIDESKALTVNVIDEDEPITVTPEPAPPLAIDLSGNTPPAPLSPELPATVVPSPFTPTPSGPVVSPGFNPPQPQTPLPFNPMVSGPGVQYTPNPLYQQPLVTPELPNPNIDTKYSNANTTTAAEIDAMEQRRLARDARRLAATQEYPYCLDRYRDDVNQTCDPCLNGPPGSILNNDGDCQVVPPFIPPPPVTPIEAATPVITPVPPVVPPFPIPLTPIVLPENPVDAKSLEQLRELEDLAGEVPVPPTAPIAPAPAVSISPAVDVIDQRQIARDARRLAATQSYPGCDVKYRDVPNQKCDPCLGEAAGSKLNIDGDCEVPKRPIQSLGDILKNADTQRLLEEQIKRRRVGIAEGKTSDEAEEDSAGEEDVVAADEKKAQDIMAPVSQEVYTLVDNFCRKTAKAGNASLTNIIKVANALGISPEDIKGKKTKNGEEKKKTSNDYCIAIKKKYADLQNQLYDALLTQDCDAIDTSLQRLEVAIALTNSRSKPGFVGGKFNDYIVNNYKENEDFKNPTQLRQQDTFMKVCQPIRNYLKTLSS